jgi:hypothetical protein
MSINPAKKFTAKIAKPAFAGSLLAGVGRLRNPRREFIRRAAYGLVTPMGVF